MQIKEFKYHRGCSASVYPFDQAFTHVTAEAHQQFGEEGMTYGVNWPSIGSVPAEEARQFAAAIIAACEWLEKQKEEASCRS
jgi:hypothetical protein